MGEGYFQALDWSGEAISRVCKGDACFRSEVTAQHRRVSLEGSIEAEWLPESTTCHSWNLRQLRVNTDSIDRSRTLQLFTDRFGWAWACVPSQALSPSAWVTSWLTRRAFR
jgi:hypothetical protein